MNFLPAIFYCVDAVDIFTQLRQGGVFLLGEQQNFKWTLRRGREGGRGSDLNVQLTLSGGKANMLTAPYRVNIASVRLTFL